jgi:hypothetical protein
MLYINQKVVALAEKEKVSIDAMQGYGTDRRLPLTQ